jgi:hypothetical protein
MPVCRRCHVKYSHRRLSTHGCEPDTPAAAAKSARRAESPQRDRSASPSRTESSQIIDDNLQEPIFADDQPESPHNHAELPLHGIQRFSLSLPRATFSFMVLLRLWSICYNISTAALTFLLRLLSTFIPGFPSLTPFLLNRHCHLDDSRLRTLVICPKCNTSYQLAECVERTSDGRETAKTCMAVPWPHHPQRARRGRCGAQLLQRRGKHWIPILAFHHVSFIEKLSELLQRYAPSEHITFHRAHFDKLCMLFHPSTRLPC